MSWYKRAQAQEQMNLPWEEQWMQTPSFTPQPAQPEPEDKSYENVEDDLDDTEDSSLENLTAILDKHKVNYEVFTFDNIPEDLRADPIIVFEAGETTNYWGGRDKKKKVLEVGSLWPRPTEVCEWIMNLSDMDLYGYIPEVDFNQEFWDGVSTGYSVFHGTSAERIKDIMKHGLEPRNESRGITNKWDGAGVYTSASPDMAKYHYEVVIEINVSAMKADGYMPRVRGESPIEDTELRNSLAHLLGADCQFATDSSDGLAEDTLVFQNKIPPKYLTVLD